MSLAITSCNDKKTQNKVSNRIENEKESADRALDKASDKIEAGADKMCIRDRVGRAETILVRQLQLFEGILRRMSS